MCGSSNHLGCYVHLCTLGADGGGREGDIDSELMQAAMMAAAGSCLVCLCSIKRVDAVRTPLGVCSSGMVFVLLEADVVYQ